MFTVYYPEDHVALIGSFRPVDPAVVRVAVGGGLGGGEGLGGAGPGYGDLPPTLRLIDYKTKCL